LKPSVEQALPVSPERVNTARSKGISLWEVGALLVNHARRRWLNINFQAPYETSGTDVLPHVIHVMIQNRKHSEVLVHNSAILRTTAHRGFRWIPRDRSQDS